MEEYKPYKFMFFHGLAGRRWCGKNLCRYGMPQLGHAAGTGALPLKPCAGQSGEI